MFKKGVGTIYGNITDVTGVKMGLVTDTNAATGCSVIIVEQGAVAGVSVRGGAPGSRETELLQPFCRVQQLHGIVLSGGSAFGLDAACGAARWLEENRFGLRAGPYCIPIVTAAIIFDLFIGRGDVRPDASWGYKAAASAGSGFFPEGNVGAGTGATVAKVAGMSSAVKSGQAGLSKLLPRGLVVAVLVVPNALGDIIGAGGKILAGPREGTIMRSSTELIQEGKARLEDGLFDAENGFILNTTLAVVATNAILSKVEANRVADVAHNGLARSITPLHTSWDGDTVFALATGQVAAPPDLVGIAAAGLLEEAVRRALLQAHSLGGIPAVDDLHKI